MWGGGAECIHTFIHLTLTLQTYFILTKIRSKRLGRRSTSAAGGSTHLCNPFLPPPAILARPRSGPGACECNPMPRLPTHPTLLLQGRWTWSACSCAHSCSCAASRTKQPQLQQPHQHHHQQQQLQEGRTTKGRPCPCLACRSPCAEGARERPGLCSGALACMLVDASYGWWMHHMAGGCTIWVASWDQDAAMSLQAWIPLGLVPKCTCVHRGGQW